VHGHRGFRFTPEVGGGLTKIPKGVFFCGKSGGGGGETGLRQAKKVNGRATQRNWKEQKKSKLKNKKGKVNLMEKTNSTANTPIV